MVDECFDLDECIVNMPCSLDLCVNTYGSFYCNCETGFIKHGGEGSLCEDIDECSLNLDNCTDICTNTNGSYECSCFPGGTLQSDNATCEIIVTDTLCNGLYNCSYTCGNGTDGNESCFCPRNRVLDPNDNSTCIPFNECLDSSDNACDTSTGAVCEDLTDGYQCSCTEGYILSDNGFRCEKCRAGRYGLDCTLMCHCEDKAKTCDHILGCTDCNDGWGGDQCKSDIDECSDALANNISICPTNSNCINTNGSYSCICETGYQMNTTDNTCDDVDECPAQPCSADAECFNAAGSYSCQCNSGFTGDGFTCSNINECLETPSRCVTLAKCVDLQPGFGCICRTGYSGDGRVNGTGCADDNECKETGQACPTPNSECVNTEGSYICQCQEYYTGDGYTSCVDTDECATGTANCTEVENGDTQCVNEEPLFSCQTSCLSGYIRYSVGGIVTCENIDECLSEPSVCPGNNVMCLDADGSFECICDENFEEVNGLCVDIDECLDTNTCPSNGHVCVNLIGGFDCACQAGHLQPNCTLDPNSYFLAVSQLLQTPFLPEWADLSSPEFVKFGEEFERVPANPDQTFVSFEVVYNEDDIPVDLEQRVFYALVEDNFQLTFNDTVVADLAQIQFNGETLDCSVVRCENNFTCVFDGYPYCDCSSDYTGYDCSVMVVTDQESSTNLLPLWISVGIASALLVVGLGACCAFLAVSYRRRHLARHRPPLHRTTKGLVRTPRGPTIFNPTQRMPTEAYNYQFPVGSVRSSSSDTSSISSHQTSLTSAPVGRIGSSMPFAPRWPRAYYKQLDDEDN
ncbi:hypothetical protein EB796_024803 [Bugula neritina]|uniref:EGF-like domain-containing protein n=1 Tax=Bugula neritina TaxID=10212 RepID=A0A7J7IU06_BUGNE|nr:hypothetical protein EB796_024803 [Bugula neritina]